MLPNRPDRDALFQALRQTLEALQPRLEGRARFELRVALRAVDTLAREARDGAAAEATEREALAQLLQRQASLADLRAEACRRFADGRLDPTEPQVIAALRAGVVARLAIDNPRFAAVEADGAA